MYPRLPYPIRWIQKIASQSVRPKETQMMSLTVWPLQHMGTVWFKITVRPRKQIYIQNKSYSSKFGTQFWPFGPYHWVAVPVGNHGKPVRSQTASWGPWRHLQSSAHPACRVNICMGKLRQAQKKQVHAVQSVQIFVQLFFNKWKEPETLIEGSGNHSCPMFL